MDIQKQIDYWRDGSEADLKFARGVVQSGNFRYGMFFAHPAVEKMLKAHVVRKTGEIPPKSHKLSRLAQLAGLSLTRDRLNFLVMFQIYLIEGRYPDSPLVPLDPQMVNNDFVAAEEMIQWLKNQL